MRHNQKTNTVSIPESITKGQELIVISSKEYETFLNWRREVDEVLEKVKRGKKAYKEGRTIIAESPRDLI